MRTRISRAVILAALCSTLVMAQRMRPRANAGTPPDPATMIARRVNMLKTVLNLTDAQATQATTIFTSEATAGSQLRSDLQAAHTALRDAVKTNNTAAIDQQAAAIGNLTGQMTANQAKADAAFYVLLTPDQQARYDQLGPRGMMGGPGRFGMGPGGPPPNR